jgi:regulator of protease activity HflC (stomatin/prohibitin superfamily)
MKNKARSLVVIVAIAALVVWSVLAIVPPGHVGVLVTLGKVDTKPVPEGLSFKNPIAGMVAMSVRTQTLTMAHQQHGGAVEAITADGLMVHLDVTVAHKLHEAMAPWVFRNLGTDYANSVIIPSARLGVREATARFKSEDAYATRRAELQVQLQSSFAKALSQMLSGYKELRGAPFEVQLLIRNIEPPKRLKESIEMKLQAQQEAQKMQFVLDRERHEMERKKIEAQGIAEYQKIVSQNLTESLLRLRGIEASEKISAGAKTKVLFIGDPKSGLPLLLPPESLK